MRDEHVLDDNITPDEAEYIIPPKPSYINEYERKKPFSEGYNQSGFEGGKVVMDNEANQSDVAYKTGTDQDGKRAPFSNAQFPGNKMPQENNMQKKRKLKHSVYRNESRHKERR